MFTTTEDMKILEVFSSFSTTVIWSQLFQHGVTKALVNVDQFIPVTKLADTLVNLPEIVAPEKYLYTFKKKDDNTVFLDPQPVIEKFTAVCMERLVYPNTSVDRAHLEDLKSIFIASVQQSLENLENLLLNQKMALKLIPDLGPMKKVKKELEYYNIVVETDDVVDLTSGLEKLIEDDIQKLIGFSTGKWKTITHPDELIVLESNNRLILQKVNTLSLKLWTFMANPFSMIPYENFENVNVIRKPEVGYTNSSGSLCFLLYFPEEKGINWIEFPLKKFQVLDINWIGFFKMTFPDILFSIFCGLSMFGFISHAICEGYEMYKRKKSVLQYRARSRSIPFQVRKINTSKRPSLISQGERTPDLQYEESPEPVRKTSRKNKKARKPKKHHKVHVHIERDTGKQQDAQWGIVRILNMNTPVGDGHSDISE